MEQVRAAEAERTQAQNVPNEKKCQDALPNNLRTACTPNLCSALPFIRIEVGTATFRQSGTSARVNGRSWGAKIRCDAKDFHLSQRVCASSGIAVQVPLTPRPTNLPDRQGDCARL